MPSSSRAPIIGRTLGERSLPWLDIRFPARPQWNRRLFSSELREVKPDPAIYTQIIARLAADPAEVIFFDDRPENVTGASGAGLQAHLFTDTSQLDRLPPTEDDDTWTRHSQPPSWLCPAPAWCGTDAHAFGQTRSGRTRGSAAYVSVSDI